MQLYNYLSCLALNKAVQFLMPYLQFALPYILINRNLIWIYKVRTSVHTATGN